MGLGGNGTFSSPKWSICREQLLGRLLHVDALYDQISLCVFALWSISREADQSSLPMNPFTHVASAFADVKDLLGSSDQSI